MQTHNKFLAVVQNLHQASLVWWISYARYLLQYLPFEYLWLFLFRV